MARYASLANLGALVARSRFRAKLGIRAVDSRAWKPPARSPVLPHVGFLKSSKPQELLVSRNQLFASVLLFCWLAGSALGQGISGTSLNRPGTFSLNSPIIGDPTSTYRIQGKLARRNRQVTGPVTSWVQGVPAEPVDSFTYDGVGSDPVDAQIDIEVNPVTNTGTIRCDWSDEHGDWSWYQDFFAHPEHPSGMRISSTSTATNLVLNDPVIADVYMHGDTTAGLPAVPTLHSILSCWGPGSVTLNGQPFDNPFDGPFLPQWEGHVMVTHGVREPDGTVRTLFGDVYDPSLHAGIGYTDYDDLEVHFTFHDMRFPMTNNHPAIFSFFYHLMFEKVSITVEHKHLDPDQ